MLADNISQVDFSHCSLKSRTLLSCVIGDLENAERFLFDEKSSKLATEIMTEAINKSQMDELISQVVFPFDNFWLEYRGVKAEGLFGMLVTVNDDRVFVMSFGRGVDRILMTKPSVFDIELRHTFNLDFPEIEEDNTKYDLAVLVSLLAVLNAKKIVEHKSSDLSKVNKARSKKGKPLLFEHTLVKIRHEARDAVHQPASGFKGKRLHHVRTFTRLKRGKLELVRHHWRGDAALGVVTHDYKV